MSGTFEEHVAWLYFVVVLLGIFMYAVFAARVLTYWCMSHTTSRLTYTTTLRTCRTHKIVFAPILSLVSLQCFTPTTCRIFHIIIGDTCIIIFKRIRLYVYMNPSQVIQSLGSLRQPHTKTAHAPTISDYGPLAEMYPKCNYSLDCNISRYHLIYPCQWVTDCL